MKLTSFASKIEVTGEAADGSRHALVVLQAADNLADFGYSILVKLPDVKADPQEVADLKLQLEGNAGVMKSMSDEIDQWKKRFDALLFQKGGAA